MSFLNQKYKPNLSGIKLIFIDLTSELLDVDSERDLFRKLRHSLVSRIECSVYIIVEREAYIIIEKK